MPRKKEEKVTEGEIVEETKKPVNNKKKTNDGRLFLGIIFILFGGLIFINNLFPAIEVSKYFWPVILIIFGLALIFRSFQGE